jgi:hypothetical protein
MASLTISTSGVCPSNRGAGFPNLAREQNPPAEVIAEVTATAEAELKAAGIEVSILPVNSREEVPSKAVGNLSMWFFERDWYYWRAHGPGLPVEVAERLHTTYGRQVRVDGHCGCPSPREWFKGFGVGSYHVDTPEGLKALADAILSVYDASKNPNATPRTGGKG